MAQGLFRSYYEFINSDQLIDVKYFCAVCQNVLQDPMLTDCGQHYCKSCLPETDKTSSTLDKQLQQEINELKIYCVNRFSKSCYWEGKLLELDQHLRSSCPIRETKCRHCGDTYACTKKAHLDECQEYTVKCLTGCGAKMKRKDIEEHKKSCPLEEVVCRLNGPNENHKILSCRKRMLRGELSSHEKVCPFRTFECKFCHKVIRRVYMEQHLKECPLELIQCERWEEGCREMVPRKDLSSHMKSYKKEHQEYVWFAYLKKREELKAAKKETQITLQRLLHKTEQLSTRDAELNRVKVMLNQIKMELAAADIENEILKNTESVQAFKQAKQDCTEIEPRATTSQVEEVSKKKTSDIVKEADKGTSVVESALYITKGELEKLLKEANEKTQKADKAAKVANERKNAAEAELYATKRELEAVNRGTEDEIKKVREKLENELYAAETELYRTKTQLSEARNQVEQAEESTQKAEVMAKEADERKNAAERRLYTTECEMKAVVEKLKEMTQTAEKTARLANERKYAAEAELYIIQRESEAIKKATEDEIQKVKKELADEKKVFHATESELCRSKGELETVRKELQIANETAQSAEKAEKAAETKKNAVKSKLHTIQRELEAARDEIQKGKKELADKRRALYTAESELSRTKSQLEVVRQALEIAETTQTQETETADTARTPTAIETEEHDKVKAKPPTSSNNLKEKHQTKLWGTRSKDCQTASHRSQ